MRGILVAAAAAVLAACASTGVVPMDGDRLMIAQSGAAPGNSGDTVLAGLYREATEHCATKGKSVETLEREGKDPIPFVRAASARLEFRCVAK